MLARAPPSRYVSDKEGVFEIGRYVEFVARSGRSRGKETASIEVARGRFFVMKTREGNRSFAYLRNLLYTRKFVIVHLLFLLLPRRSDGPAGTKATVNVLWFLLRWLQDLQGVNGCKFC